MALLKFTCRSCLIVIVLASVFFSCADKEKPSEPNEQAKEILQYLKSADTKQVQEGYQKMRLLIKSDNDQPPVEGNLETLRDIVYFGEESTALRAMDLFTELYKKYKENELFTQNIFQKMAKSVEHLEDKPAITNRAYNLLHQIYRNHKGQEAITRNLFQLMITLIEKGSPNFNNRAIDLIVEIYNNSKSDEALKRQVMNLMMTLLEKGKAQDNVISKAINLISEIYKNNKEDQALVNEIMVLLTKLIEQENPNIDIKAIDLIIEIYKNKKDSEELRVKVVKLMFKLLDHNNPSIRSRAILRFYPTLAKTQEEKDALLSQLKLLLQDAEPYIRFQAMDAIWNYRTLAGASEAKILKKDLFDLILEKLNDENGFVVGKSVRYLTYLNPREAANHRIKIVSLLNKDYGQYTNYARSFILDNMPTLFKDAPKEGIPHLIKFLNDKGATQVRLDFYGFPTTLPASKPTIQMIVINSLDQLTDKDFGKELLSKYRNQDDFEKNGGLEVVEKYRTWANSNL